MGQVTPNIGIYIPSAGETNYDSSFSVGQVNIDQHDHSGGPHSGIPIAASAIPDDAITYPKLNANVADITTGVGTSGVNLNQIVMLGILKNIYTNATPTGFLSKDGAVANARTLTGTANQIAITNPAGVAGNPTFSIAAPLLIPLNPSFKRYANAPIPTVTGDGTVYHVLFNTSLYDRAANAGAQFFTAPGEGTYAFVASISLTGITIAQTYCEVSLVCSSGEVILGWAGNPWAVAVGGALVVQVSGQFNLTVGQTVDCVVEVAGVGLLVGVFGDAGLANSPSFFSGTLLN